MKIAKSMLLAALLMAGCKEEPSIVIKFEPNDLSGKAAAKVEARDAAPVVAANECKSASDCVAVNEDCCNCANGGKQVAMAIAASIAHGKQLAARCKDTVCTAMMSNDPSCAKGPDCVAGKCVLAEIKPKAKTEPPKTKTKKK